LTPRQAAAFLFLGRLRTEREAALNLSVSALAASGDGKQIKKQVENWSDQ